MPGIKNSWSFIGFAKTHGQPKLTKPATYTNSQTGEEFTARSVAFVHPTEKDEQGRAAVCFVGFSRNLGELSASEIASRASELQVVQTNEDKYILCGSGTNSWEDINVEF